MRGFTHHIITVVFVLALAGCSSLPAWMGSSESETPLEGKRVAALEIESTVQADPSLSSITIEIPTAKENSEWTQDGVWNSSHLAAASPVKPLGSYSVTSAAEKDYRLRALPVIADNTLYVLGGSGEVNAYTLGAFETPIWQFTVPRLDVPQELVGISLGKSPDPFQGGGIAFANNIVFVTTSEGQVFALDSKMGSVAWQRDLGVPIRSNPVVVENVLYFVSVDNEVFALDAAKGETLWTVPGVREITSILGHPSPAVSDSIVIAPLSSGEMTAIKTSTGRPVWSDSLAASAGRSSSLFTLNDINATPVVSGTTVYAVSHEGILTAIDIASGKRIWEEKISSIATPWIAGDFLYIVSTGGELLAINRADGRIKWVTKLPMYNDMEEKKDPIVWNGPVLAGGALYVVGSNGQMLAVSPFDGKTTESYEVPEHIYLPPIVANGTLYLLDNSGTLTVLK